MLLITGSGGHDGTLIDAVLSWEPSIDQAVYFVRRGSIEIPLQVGIPTKPCHGVFFIQSTNTG